MIKRRWAAGALVIVAVAGCGPGPGPGTTPSPQPSPAVSATSPTTTSSQSTTPRPTASLPLDFPVSGLLDGGAARVVAKLDAVGGFRPALKLDVTTEQVTLTVLAADDTAKTYRWRDDVIEEVDSDVRYVGQTTFRPTAYRLDDLRRIFDVAALLGARAERQVLQVQEYRTSVYLTVTTRPETKTIFFRPDGTAIRQLGTSAVGDIADGIADVTAGTSAVIAVGFSAESGYWADVPLSDGVVERRSRLGNLPAFASQRNDATQLKPFSPSLIEAAAIAQAIASFRSGVTQSCTVEIDNRLQRSAPVVRYDCGGRIFYTDLTGRDMTALVS